MSRVGPTPLGPDGPGGVEIQDEQALIRGCLAGDRASCDRFYRTFHRLVAGNLYRVLGDRHELEDLVQEVFVIAYRGMPRFRGDAKLSTWMYRICVNVALGRLRSRARRPQSAETVSLELVAPGAGPEQQLADRQELARVYAVLEQLAPKKRVVFVLHEIQGLDIKEIASIVEAPLITVRTRLHYARKEFYRLIAQGDAATGVGADRAGGGGR